MRPRAEPIARAYKPWLVLSLVTLVGSLAIFAAAVVAAFVSFNDQRTPLWVVVLGVLSVLGIAIGFAGFFILLATAGVRAWREARKVQVLPPDEQTGPSQASR